MGDTQSVAWLLRGRPDDPEQESWGGRFVRAWERPRATCDWLTNADDRFEQFSIVELTLPVGPIAPSEPFATMENENQSLVGDFESEGSVRFRFSPKDPKTYAYTLRSNIASLDGQSGEMTSFVPPPDSGRRPSKQHPNWWTDEPRRRRKATNRGEDPEPLARGLPPRLCRTRRAMPNTAQITKFGCGLRPRDHTKERLQCH